MTNVVRLNGDRVPELGTPNVPLIKALKDRLASAESGNLQSFIGTGFITDGGRMSVWVDHHVNVYEMLGSIAWLEHEYVHRHTHGDAE